jgi:hypothetical protein
MRVVAFVSVAVALAFSNTVQAEPLKTDDQIRRALVGNTITGMDDDEPYNEYLHPDGRIIGENQEGRYTGHWMISGGQMCLRYSTNGKESTWDCSEIELDGSRITWMADGEKSFSNLIIGNPNGF